MSDAKKAPGPAVWIMEKVGMLDEGASFNALLFAEALRWDEESEAGDTDDEYTDEHGTKMVWCSFMQMYRPD